MKQVKINVGYVGLVFKNGDYIRCITAGKHWLKWGQVVKVYNMAHYFTAPIALEILLKDKKLAEILEIIEVSDSEVVMVEKSKRKNSIIF